MTAYINWYLSNIVYEAIFLSFFFTAVICQNRFTPVVRYRSQFQHNAMRMIQMETMHVFIYSGSGVFYGFFMHRHFSGISDKNLIYLQLQLYNE